MPSLIILGLCFNTIGSFLLGFPLLKNKEDIIKQSNSLSAPMTLLNEGQEYMEILNESVKKSLEKDNKIGFIGLLSLVIGFILQIIGLLI
ncbi:MAG: hypothetical protein OEY49_08770 [Candidatus Heimdallarchaeota archaeon]|nr:hypothetical protein [Candidatus Heimdallarchaeota archaeon]